MSTGVGVGADHARPKPKKRCQLTNQTAMAFDAGDDLSSKDQEYNPTPIINEIRTYVESGGTCGTPTNGSSRPKPLASSSTGGATASGA